MVVKLFPIFYENSKIPKLVGKVSPIDPYAVSFGLWVWCRGELSPRLRRHEHIHYLQQKELLWVFQWILYLLFYLILRIRLNGVSAYRRNPFELEAYDNDEQENYEVNRKNYAWIKYVIPSLKGESDDF